MLWLIIVILSIALIIFITLYFMYLREIKNLSDQLEKINSSNSNSKMLLSFSNRGIGALAQNINNTLEEKKKIEIEYRKMDKKR